MGWGWMFSSISSKYKMTSRRAGYDSLVHRHQLQSLLARSFDADHGESGQPAQGPSTDDKLSEGNGAVRRAYGNDEIGRIASAIEESVPWSAGILDLFWQRVDDVNIEETTADDGPRVERPRPEKKATDLTKVTEEYERYISEKKKLERQRKEEEEKRRLEEKDKMERQMEQEAMARSVEFANGIERMRAMFFGRPSQQIRLLKRDCQIERNKAEYYCSVWKHLKEDSETELGIQEEIIHRATKQKGDAASRADNLRGKEKGARQAALHLKGCQLLDAAEKSNMAADRFGAEAEEEEQKARIARAELEDAEENKLIEQEKINACEVQIKYNQKLAKKALEEATQREREEIMAVIDEEDRLIKARPNFDAELANSPALSSKAKSCQDDMDKIDRRLALLAMEQEMFRPSYLQVTSTTMLGGRGASTVNIFIAKRMAASPGKSKIEVHDKPFEWKMERQTPGTICLGRSQLMWTSRRGAEESGLLFQRSVVVHYENEFRNIFKSRDWETFLSLTESSHSSGNLKKWIKHVQDKALFNDEKKAMRSEIHERWSSLGQEILQEFRKCVVVTSDYFAKDDLFISRANFKSKQARTLLDKKLFGRIWDQKTCIIARKRLNLAAKADDIVKQLEDEQIQQSHDLGTNGLVQLDRVTVRLRHIPQHLWLTTYAQTSKSKLHLSVFNNNSHLGPKLHGYVPVCVPNLDPRDDLSFGIDDADGRPRKYGIVWKVMPLDSQVKEGDDVIVLRVFDERKMVLETMQELAEKNKRVKAPKTASFEHPDLSQDTGAWEFPPVTIKAPASGKFTGLCPAIWKLKDSTEKEKNERAELQLFDWSKPKTHGYLDHGWISKAKSLESNDILYSYNLKVFSFEKIAFIEQSEDGWEANTLPVAEWPDLFFKDFKHFFVR